ncbi:hypothetical protein EV292_104127 [Sphingomonas sp. BK235]|nr:hypothetical protein EV292_104127 [Sphingomonas sp. BK235]
MPLHLALALAGAIAPAALPQQPAAPRDPAAAPAAPAPSAEPLVAVAPEHQRVAANGDIIVAAPPRRVISNQVRTLIGPESQNQPLARYQQPLCVAVAGLPRDVNGTIANRVLDDAEAVGIRLAGRRCTPNTMILFVDDAHAQVSRMVKRGHRALLGVGWPVRRALLRATGPAFAWRLTELRTRGGEPAGPEPGPPVFRNADVTRIDHPVRLDVVGAVLIVERRAAIGKTPQQLGDYAALRLLAGALQPAGTGLPTMLRLFDPDAPAPAALTAFDRGFLRGLYLGPATARQGAQRARMTSAIVRESAAP